MFIICGLLQLNVLCSVIFADPFNDVPRSDVPKVEAVTGHPVGIPCNVPFPLADDEASLILWYRLDLPNPIYTLDARNAALAEARHFPAPELEGRARFDVQVHPPLLRLDHVVAADEADYKCRVDLKRSRTLILHSKLDVIVPPGMPIIMDEHGQHLHDVIGPYDEGSTLLFICEVDGGDPPPEVTWWRGPTLLDDDFNATRQEFVRNELVVENIRRRDWMAEYICRASNTNATTPKEVALKLDMNLYPLELAILMPEHPLTAGVEYVITCETRGSRPKAISSWWLDSYQVITEVPEMLSEDGNTTLSTLRFRPVPEDNWRTLACRSANPALPSVTLETNVTLEVQYLPQLNLTLAHPVSEESHLEGSDIYLHCHVTSHPRVHNITWEFEGQLLTVNKTIGIVILNDTLFLQRIGKEQRGRYRCLSTNSLGVGSSNDLHLRVQFAPVCRSSDPVFFGVTTGETLNLTCSVESNPFEVIFQWLFVSYGNSSDDADSTFNLTNNESILHYSPKDDAGYGNIMCWGKNAIGRQKEPCVFRVVPAGPPDPVRDCTVVNRTADTLTVECTAGYNGSLSPLYHMELYNSVAEYMSKNMTNADGPYFYVSGLSPSTSYVLVVYGSNSKGRSKSTALVALTLSPAKRRTAREVPVPFSPVIGVLIGAILVILVTAVVIATVIRSRTVSDNIKKDTSFAEEKFECGVEKKDLDEGQDSSGKGPDIIPLSKDQEGVMGKAADLSDFNRGQIVMARRLGTSTSETA